MQATMTRPPIGGLFPLVVSQSGTVPRHGLAEGRASARVAILHGREGRVVVAMTDGDYGASITNSAEELVGFLYLLHLQELGVALDDVRWIYRDSEGNWDEIIPALVHGVTVCAVKYRPLGSRKQADAWFAINAEGVSISDDEKAMVGESLGLAPVMNQTLEVDIG